ncbi:hypothetical protein DL771_008831 [Monosporascus sp. 5C6A]|nr:hypothetical protein DL771_008831 [Monosporascus sp. 5C6A]
MPRPKKPGAPEPKRRSRNGCWPCKSRKINCQRTGEKCDYSIRLNWDGRRGKRPEGVLDFGQEVMSPTTPAPTKGFKLVHQYPSTNAPGSRRLEPLTGATSEPRPDTSRIPQGKVSPLAEGSGQTFDDLENLQRSTKRARFNVDAQTQTVEQAEKRPCSSRSWTVDSDTASLRFPTASGMFSGESPRTPATSSTYSDDDPRQSARPELQSSSSSAIRRLSVGSLLSTASGTWRPQDGSADRMTTQLPMLDAEPKLSSKEVTFYGIDRGFTDFDLGKNDDQNAITGLSPLLRREYVETPLEDIDLDLDLDLFPNEFGFGVETCDMNNEAGGYYAKPVSIYISRNLEPLPSKLTENPMNILHHFLNHTARVVLVPYDDPHANPFRTILPQMAVRDDNLLALLLAYSASHRARVLNQPEPTLRIAIWVDDIFPALRQALASPGRNFSDANLATAIMLASLEIISPRVFGYEIPWQRHLSLARELIAARPGGLRGMQINFRDDPVSSFLWSWAAYLDVIGSLSGGRKEPSSAWIFAYEYDDIVDGYDEIDCIMGFTTRCIYLLAKVADLAGKCDAERIGEDHNIRSDWRPSEDIIEQAEKLEADIYDSVRRPPVPCKHIHTKGDLEKWDRVGLTATNEAFHWAALVHLYRRVQGKPSDDNTVQDAVQSIITCFDNIRPGGAAEFCLLFPMFTAGCDARDEGQRALILEKFVIAETHGMTQVHNARRLMQRILCGMLASISWDMERLL